MCQNNKNTIHDGVIKTMHKYDKHEFNSYLETIH